MTRKSRREIERAVDDLAEQGGPSEDMPAGPAIVYDTDDGYLDMDGNPAPTDDDGNLLPAPWGSTIIFDAEYVEDLTEGRQP